jgi:hypothetical protein
MTRLRSRGSRSRIGCSRIERESRDSREIPPPPELARAVERLAAKLDEKRKDLVATYAITHESADVCPVHVRLTRLARTILPDVWDTRGYSLSIMSMPLKPSTPAALLAAASRLAFHATSRDRSGSTLGVLVDSSGAQQHLTITSGDTGSTWALFPSLPVGLKPVLLYESAANVFRGGSAQDGGSIGFQGDSYDIESSFDGNEWTAKVSGSR